MSSVQKVFIKPVSDGIHLTVDQLNVVGNGFHNCFAEVFEEVATIENTTLVVEVTTELVEEVATIEDTTLVVEVTTELVEEVATIENTTLVVEVETEVVEEVAAKVVKDVAAKVVIEVATKAVKDVATEVVEEVAAKVVVEVDAENTDDLIYVDQVKRQVVFWPPAYRQGFVKQGVATHLCVSPKFSNVSQKKSNSF
jgi:hypothetical protein